MKTAADLIANAAGDDVVERRQRDLTRSRIEIALGLLEQEQQQRFLRKLGCDADAAVEIVEVLRRLLDQALEQLRRDRARLHARLHVGRDDAGDALGLAHDRARIVAPVLVDLLHHLLELRLREIGDRGEWLEFRREEDVVGPAAGLVQHLGGDHVGLVDLGTALAIDP